jgi:outer membrane protein TolC
MGDHSATVEHAPGFPFDASLIPGRSIEPIDLANVLGLAGARVVDIALARQQVNQAIADLEQARALWLPSLFIGPTWYREDGQVQTITGQVQPVSRNSLFIGGLAASTAPGFAAASPGTGYPPLNGTSAVFRFSDAIYMPLAARRVVAANMAGVRANNNDAILNAAEAYFDLQLASGRLAIAREAAANATTLSEITGSYARTGQGLEADHRRALTELRHRRKDVNLAEGQLLVASANLVALLVLDPRVVIAPVEPAEATVRLIPEDIPLDDLVVKGLHNRPELAGAQELVQATLFRLKQAKLRPFVPSLAFSYAGGGFGGGPNAFYGNFGARGDFAASLFWQLYNLGFGDRAIIHRRAAEHESAQLDVVKTEARVAGEVIASYEARQAATRQIAESAEAVTEALESLKLNFINIREGAELPNAARPIEVLQPIQALAQARLDYLESVLGYNRNQFRLQRAIGGP